MTLMKAHPKDYVYGMYYYSSSVKTYCLSFTKSPSTFRVFEVIYPGTKVSTSMARGPVRRDDKYAHIVLCKEGVDTFEAIDRVAQEFGIGYDDIGIAGLKDANAYTCQLISVPNSDEILKRLSDVLRIDKISLYLLRTDDLGVDSRSIMGNYFELTINCCSGSLKEVDEVLKSLSSDGFLNYYGYQRFGVSRPITHHVGKLLILREWDNAIRIYLGEPSSYEPKEVQEARRLFLKGDYEGALSMFPRRYRYERLILKALIEGVEGLKAIKKLAKNTICLFINAYQSYLFNLMINKLVDIYEDIKKLWRINDLGFVPGYNTPCTSSDEVSKVCKEVINEEGIDLKYFKINELRLNITGWFRALITKPKHLRYSYRKDHLNISFILERGAYASMILRELLKTDPIKFN
ncbi:MAG: tRNA pseudouridine(13) synthase TruD [Thermoprotei archaeon]|nr:MAG: tRNA pseudouridine(13) synthase TruD [Thermoprotei archaeon]